MASFLIIKYRSLKFSSRNRAMTPHYSLKAFLSWMTGFLFLKTVFRSLSFGMFGSSNGFSIFLRRFKNNSMDFLLLFEFLSSATNKSVFSCSGQLKTNPPFLQEFTNKYWLALLAHSTCTLFQHDYPEHLIVAPWFVLQIWQIVWNL